MRIIAVHPKFLLAFLIMNNSLILFNTTRKTVAILVIEIITIINYILPYYHYSINNHIHIVVPTRFVLFHGESHGLSRGGKPKNRITRLTEIADWMDKYLK